MSAPTAARATSAPSRPPGRRRALLQLMVVGLVTAALGAGAWGWHTATSLNPRNTVAVGEALAVPGGQLRIDAVDIEGAHDMDGMPDEMMPDMAADGLQRTVVRFTLQGTEPEGLRYGPDLMRADSDARAPVETARLQLASGTVPQDATLAGLVVLDVPLQASVVRLSVEGADGWAVADLEAADAPHDHGSHDHGSHDHSPHGHEPADG